ncbi:Retrovirus-related Pol polyprotein from transposon TNT 1-94 [Sesamum angolense]|uniref:Retrovirus-related Pol polyprotein from transposon TNT 1-94 n=1 Tax=Sesamum angolense TaxID=2727404 RepID=A0AAE1T8T2_9LAMI|nr:Retrovirus-related Pol polyprotein from transposon TNT 1-94 [Sesamum angolense]
MKKLKPNGSVDKFKPDWGLMVLNKGGNRLFRYLFSSSSVDYNSVLIVLHLVYNLPIHQIDVKITFLYGKLQEGIYMDQSEGFVAHGNEHKVCKLVKSLYGLKQAPKQWHEKKIIEKFGYQNSRIAKTSYDSSVALFKNKSGVSVAQLRVLKYLKGMLSLNIHYGRFSVVLEGYSDASWIAKNFRSNGCLGYVFTLDGGTTSWKSAKQTLITRSTFEVELCALDTTSTEAK